MWFPWGTERHPELQKHQNDAPCKKNRDTEKNKADLQIQSFFQLTFFSNMAHII